VNDPAALRPASRPKRPKHPDPPPPHPKLSRNRVASTIYPFKKAHTIRPAAQVRAPRAVPGRYDLPLPSLPTPCPQYSENRPPPASIGFVSHARPPFFGHQARYWLCLAHVAPRNWVRLAHAASRYWVRLAHVASRNWVCLAYVASPPPPWRARHTPGVPTRTGYACHRFGPCDLPLALTHMRSAMPFGLQFEYSIDTIQAHQLAVK